MAIKLFSKLSSHRRTHITLEVREGNLPAQLFFRKQGFRAVRVLRAFYEDSGEDAYLMRHQLAGTKENQWHPVNRVASYTSTEETP